MFITGVHDYEKEGPTLQHSRHQEEEIRSLVSLSDALSNQPWVFVLALDAPIAFLAVDCMAVADYEAFVAPEVEELGVSEFVEFAVLYAFENGGDQVVGVESVRRSGGDLGELR